ncbi:recombination protein 2 [Actinobacillus equuli]|nr:recombination protein 2 [Actinobacillus equuli]
MNKLTSPHSGSLRVQWLEYVRKQLEPFPSKGLLLALALVNELGWPIQIGSCFNKLLPLI